MKLTWIYRCLLSMFVLLLAACRPQGSAPTPGTEVLPSEAQTEAPTAAPVLDSPGALPTGQPAATLPGPPGDQEKAQKQTYELVVFYSPLWSTCREVVPIVNGLEKQYGGRLKVVRVNVRNQDTLPLQEEFGFTATPELFLVDESGTVIGHWDEVISTENLKQAIDQITG